MKIKNMGRAVLFGGSFALSIASNANATLVNLGPGSFTPQATVITFSEVSLGTVNPTYNLVAGSLGNVNVSFGAAFVGQTVIDAPSPPALPGVKTITGTPTGPLTLNTTVQTFTVQDGANPTSPVLSGTPTFNGPISVLFSVAVAAVGLDGGYFNSIGATRIEAYDANGNVLGSIVNSVLGIETYGLADASGNNIIKGISFYITGDELAGFAIDNLTFGAADVVKLPRVPDAGSSLMLLTSSLLGLGFLKRRK